MGVLFRKQALLPLALLIIGVMMLNGCLIIPATHLFQTNGKRTPDALIGKNPSDPVILGKTKIEDALIVLVNQSYGRVPSVFESVDRPKTMLWTMNDDGSQFEIAYVVKTSTSIWPLCFAAFPDGDERRLRLDVDREGVVQSFDDSKPDGPDRGTWGMYLKSEQIDKAFDKYTQKKLEDAGLLPDEHESAQRRAIEAAAATQAIVGETTTRPVPTSQP